MTASAAAAAKLQNVAGHLHKKSGELDNSQLSSYSSSLSNNVLFFPLPFLVVTATAELKERPSSDTLASCWSKNDKIGLVAFFTVSLVAFFALVDLAAGFATEGFAAGLAFSLSVVPMSHLVSLSIIPNCEILANICEIVIAICEIVVSICESSVLAISGCWASEALAAAMPGGEAAAGKIKESFAFAAFNEDKLFPSRLTQIEGLLITSMSIPSLKAFQPALSRWHIPDFIPVCWGPESRAGFLFRPDSGGIRPQHP